MALWTEENKKEKKVKKDVKSQEKRFDSVVHTLMSTIEGRAFVYDFLEDCHCFLGSFSLNALQMAFREGERQVGNRLLARIMRACPNYYLLMAKEYNERSTDNSDRERPSGDTGDDTAGEHPGGEDAGGPDQDGDRTDENAPDPYGYYKGRRR